MTEMRPDDQILRVERAGKVGQCAPFYDWENARTLGRRDVPFWQRVALEAERIGARTRLRDGTHLHSAGARRRDPGRRRSVGADCSLARPRERSGTLELLERPGLSRLCAPTSARCRSGAGGFAMVLAPHGVLQSLIRERDLSATLESVARRGPARRDIRHRSGSRRPELARIHEQSPARGAGTRGGAHLTLVESVRQDPEAPAHDVRTAVRRTPGQPHDASTASI